MDATRLYEALHSFIRRSVDGKMTDRSTMYDLLIATFLYELSHQELSVYLKDEDTKVIEDLMVYMDLGCFNDPWEEHNTNSQDIIVSESVVIC